MSDNSNPALAQKLIHFGERLRQKVEEEKTYWDKTFEEQKAVLEAGLTKVKVEPTSELDKLLGLSVFQLARDTLMKSYMVWLSALPILDAVPTLYLGLADVLSDVDGKKVENLRRALEEVIQSQEKMQVFYEQHKKGLDWAENLQKFKPKTEKRWWRWWRK